MEYRKITEQVQDLAGKWRVRVQINDTDTVFLKFNQKPTEAEVITETNKYIATVEAQVAQKESEDVQKAEDDAKLELVKDVDIEDLSTKVEEIKQEAIAEEVISEPILEPIKEVDPSAITTE